MLYLYVLADCPYCNKALAELTQKNIPFKKKIVPSDKKEKYKRKHRHKSFPQIILKIKEDKFLLGGSEVVPQIIQIYQRKLNS